MKSLLEQLTCAKRELALRRNTYPKWVASGRMRPDVAEHETLCMEAIVKTLERSVTIEEWDAQIKAEISKGQ